MSRATRTPGPWTVVEKKHGNGVVRFVYRVGPSGAPYAREVCRLRGDPGPGARVEADARLIAAAPDLLEALERVYRRLPAFRYLDTPDYRADVAAVEAALARARGEDQHVDSE